MITRKITSLLLAGLLCTASFASYAANDGPDATGTKSGGVSGSTLPPNSTPGAPSGGKEGNNGTNSSGSGSGVNGSNGGTSGSGAGGGTGAAGGGTGGAGGGTGS
ncbi:hypothetical protein [Pseudomonas frederiksbergensis]|uniref:Lipoprotein n=1 Tax=Pseudomonas frederiksbergensis TaxID=104087 RepID=A0A423KQI4_9PSED|nr:hypothetical protein [Pseudomonas frederiksbergensis]RON57445.1 hypothetical protein BK665_04900 [Pseudomonas frederiksbergensis]